MKLKASAAMIAAISLASAPVLADPPQAVPSDRVRPVADPNQKICEDVTQVGSRLATKKICATRAEWAAKRKQDRETVEDIQRLQGRPCVNAQHGTGAAPAC